LIAHAQVGRFSTPSDDRQAQIISMAYVLPHFCPIVQDNLSVAWRHFATPEDYADHLLHAIARGPSPPDLAVFHHLHVWLGNVEELGPDQGIGFLFRCITWVADVVVQVSVTVGNGTMGAPPAPGVLGSDFRDAVAARLAVAGFPVANVPLLTSVQLMVDKPAGGQHQLHPTGLATYLPVCQRLWISANDVACANLATVPMPSLRSLNMESAFGGQALWLLGGGGKSVVDAILANPQVQTLTLSRELATNLATLLAGRKVLVRGGLLGFNNEQSTSLVTLSDPSEPWKHHWVETMRGSFEDCWLLRETLQGLGVPHHQTPLLGPAHNPDPHWSCVLKPRASTLVLPGATADLVCNELVASRCYEGLDGMVNVTVLLELLAGGGSAEIHGRVLRWLVTLGPRGLGYKLN